MRTGEERLELFDRERAHLLAVAFRLLGSDADAQDVVQEAWLRYAAADLTDVRNVPAWLTRVVTRLCLDVLRRSRRGVSQPADTLEALAANPADTDDDPEQLALLAGEVTEALTVVLGVLTPAQRVALVLHDVFGIPFDEVAQVLGSTTAAAKKLASRARAEVRSREAAPAVDDRTAHRVVSAFLRAAQQGDIESLVRLLHPDVTRTADPQALPPGTAQYVRGAQTVITETRALRHNAERAHVASIDGRPGIAVSSDGRVVIALTFHLAGEAIAGYDVIADPARLARLTIDRWEDNP